MAVRWSNAARNDLARISDFNETYNLERAIAVDERLLDGADRCALNPKVGRPITGTAIRERSLSDIQYVIRYRVDAEDEITILGVRHTRENRTDP